MKKTIENQIIINELIDFYGALLTKSQLHAMKSYYQYDLSLSEIAEEHNVSRAAVLDMLNKAEKKLLDYEKKLNYRKVFQNLKQTSSEDEKEIITKIEGKLKNGI